MRIWAGLLYVVSLAGVPGILGNGCGNSASVPRKDAGLPPDVPISTGGTIGTGDAYVVAGVSGAGGSVTLGGSPGTGGTLSTGGNSATGMGGVVGSGGASAIGGSFGSGGLVGSGGATLQPVDSAITIDDAGRSVLRDGTKVQTVSLTAAQVFMQPSAPFLLQADLTRVVDELFDVSAKVLVSLSGCTGDVCNRQVTMRLSREQTTQVESWLAVIPGEACHDDPGPICDFGIHYAVGIDGPPQNQTCCKLKEWGQSGDVTGLHGYLQGLAIDQLNPLDGAAG